MQSWTHPITRIPNPRGSSCWSAIDADVPQSKSRNWIWYWKWSVQVYCHAYCDEQTILSTCHQFSTPIFAKFLDGDDQIDDRWTCRFHIHSSLFHDWSYSPMCNQLKFPVWEKCLVWMLISYYFEKLKQSNFKIRYKAYVIQRYLKNGLNSIWLPLLTRQYSNPCAWKFVKIS